MGHRANQGREPSWQARHRAAVAVLSILATATAVLALALGAYLGKTPGPVDAPAETLAFAAAPTEWPTPGISSERVLASTNAGEPSRSSRAQTYTFEWPANGWISQGMTSVHPGGIDIAAGVGEPVQAVRDGQVTYAGGDPCCSFGYYVIVRHAEGWTSLYGHLSSLRVNTGDRVRQGELLGLAGDTGKVDGPHLHFELRSSGAPVDPLKYLQPPRSLPPPRHLAAAPEETPSPPRSDEDATISEGHDATFAGQAVEIGAQWMARQEEGAYSVDAASCTAVPIGPNWSVICGAVLEGCTRASICRTTLAVCVFEQPLLVAPTC